MTKIRKPEWPKELNSPISVGPSATAASVPFGALAPGRDDTADRVRAEIQRRIGIVAVRVGCRNPDHWSEEWAHLVRGLCNYWKIPGFHDPKEQASKQIWTNEKLCELFADVCALSANRRSEVASCQYIAKFPDKFGNRYLASKETTAKSWASTLHRQFLSAKKKIKNNKRFRQSYFVADESMGILNEHVPDFGPELRRVAIERYASKLPPKVA